MESIAQAFGERFDKPVRLSEARGAAAFLNDGRDGHRLLGTPATDLQTMIDWTADWVRNDRPLLGKPTAFQVRDGKY